MILHSSIKTHAEKQDERIQAQLKQERARTIEALQEAAPIKASSLPPPNLQRPGRARQDRICTANGSPRATWATVLRASRVGPAWQHGSL
jgi:hypothetical protein